MKMLRYIVAGLAVTIAYNAQSQSKGCGAQMPGMNISFDTSKPSMGLADNYY